MCPGSVLIRNRSHVYVTKREENPFFVTVFPTRKYYLVNLKDME